MRVCKSLLKDKYFVFFIALFTLAFIVRLVPVLSGNFAFTVDQARDMLDLRNIAVGRHLTLIGPTTSINGVFLGPFWYYFNLIPYILSKGDPRALVVWLVLWFQFAGFILWYFLRKVDKLFALFASILFLFSPGLFSASSYSWNSNLMPVFSLFFSIFLLLEFKKTNMKKLFLGGILIGLCLQIQAALGILFLPFALIVLIIKRASFKNIPYLLLGFSTTLLPQLIFEFRHNFLMTKIFIGEFAGKTEILGTKLSPFETLLEHSKNYISLINEQTRFPQNIGFFIFCFAIIYLFWLLYKKGITAFSKRCFTVSLGFILFSFIIYSFYQYPLKSWFLLGLYPPILIICAVFLNELSKKKSLFKLNFFSALIFFLGLLVIQGLAVLKNFEATDRSALKNEIFAVDWVYEKANGQNFKVFSYLPSVYDYPYQYLFYWYGEKKYGYQPSLISYLENVPEYIKNNNLYLKNKKPVSEDSKTFLIIEKDVDFPQREKTWLDNFSNLCLFDSNYFNWGTEVQMLSDCKF